MSNEAIDRTVLLIRRPPFGVIAVYDHAHADDVDKALANAVVKSVSQIDHASAKELKACLAEAQAGIGG